MQRLFAIWVTVPVATPWTAFTSLLMRLTISPERLEV